MSRPHLRRMAGGALFGPLVGSLITGARCHRALLAASSTYRGTCRVLATFLATGTWDASQLDDEDHHTYGY